MGQWKRRVSALAGGTRMAARTRLPTLALVAAGFAVAVVVGIRARPEVMFDDAAITFRYALRLAEGAGFTFNDGDRTNGASAPLYTLLLAGGARAGVRPETSAAFLGVVSFAATTALAGILANRVAGRWAAAIAMALLLTSTVFQNQALSGMESGFAAMLGMGVLVALAYRRTTLAGVLIGLAVVNRLDALALAAAAVVVVVWTFRSVPRRMLVAAAAVSLPWFVFATAYFGSPIPHSATQKVAGRAGAAPFDPTWFLRAITGREGVVVLLLALWVPALFLMPTLIAELRAFPEPTSRTSGGEGAGTSASSQRWATAAMLTGLLWILLHASVYSVVDLGAPYPWYTTVVFPVLAVGAAVVAAALVRRARAGPVVLRAGFAAVLLALVFTRAPAVQFILTTVAEGSPPRFTRELDRTRRDAGRFLGARAAPDEVIRTCFGWVAYGAPHNPIDEVCPLSTRRQVPAPTWIVESPAPGEVVETPQDATLRATFATPTIDGLRAETEVYETRARR